MPGTLKTTVQLLDAEGAARAGEARVGGKASGLAALCHAGAPVPWWRVLTKEGFERHLALAGLHDRTGHALHTLTREHVDHVASALQRAVMEAPMDPVVDGLITGSVSAHLPLAVRSSVVGEDSASASHAGLYDSYLLLDDADAVRDAVLRCWASAFNPRALAYRLERGVPLEAPAMGVILQEFVAGDVSGVLFTSNPVSGRRDEALVSACWGLGEGLVGGRCNADDYVWSDGRERSVTLATKDVQVVPAPDRRGTREVAVAPQLHEARALSADRAGRLVSAGRGIAETFGAPQDIEWTYRGGELFLLQSRPITSLAPAPLGTKRIVWDNSNIQESFNGLTTPLTFSVALRAYASIYEQTLRVLGVRGAALAQTLPAVQNMLGLVSGRVYYNINNWYRCLLPLPSFGRNKEDMEHMMGLEDPVDFVEGTHLTAAEKLRRLPGMVRLTARLARMFRRIDRSVESFMTRFDAQVEATDRTSFEHASFDELLTQADRVQTEIVEHWVVPIVNDAFVMTAAGRLRRLLTRALGDDADELVAGLMSGEEAVASTEPTRCLMTLAREIHADPGLEHALCSGAPADALRRLRGRSPRIAEQLDDYIERYGDRCMGEMKLETVSLRQDPTFLVQILRNFVRRPDLEIAALDRRAQAKRRALQQTASVRLRPWQRRRLRRVLDDVHRGVAARERMRLARTRFVGLFREIYTAAGARLHEAGLLDEPTDVLYLTADELTAYRDGTAVTANLAGLARLRRDEYAAYASDEPPHHFETVGSPYRGERHVPAGTDAAGDGRTLQGTGCSPGIVEGELHVVMTAQDDLSVNGKILTTLRTDPGWAPLFPSAAGLLIERGSTLSHSAVLAREFGIPCVVGVPNLLNTVRSGERVRLDGATGRVELLERP